MAHLPHIPTPPTPKLRKRRRPSGVYRSVVKTITYRLFSTAVTVSIVLAMFGSWSAAGVFGMIDLTVATVLYYIHERLWARTEIEARE